MGVRALERGDVAWVEFGENPRGSEPAGRRPALVIQSDRYNTTRIGTVVVAALTRNTRLAGMPGNVFVPEGMAGLKFDSVVNVTQLFTVNVGEVDYPVGVLPTSLMDAVDTGLRRVLGL